MRLFQNTTIALGMMGGLALLGMPSVQAQTTDVPITGGSATFESTKIFVPQTSTSGTSSVVYEGANPTSILIQTQQGNIPTTALFRTSVLPQLSTAPGSTPAVGDTGEVLGTLSFRSAGNNPVFYNNIPVRVEFQVDALSNLSNPEATTRYNTRSFLLSEFGTAQSSGGVGVATRETPVVLVQFQPEGNPPQNRGIVPASFFTFETQGESFSADFETTLTGGEITVPTPPGLVTAENPGGSDDSSGGNSSDSGTPSVIFIGPFIIVYNGPEFEGDLGETQFNPAMPVVISGVFVFTWVPSGFWFDPPIVASNPNSTVGFDFEMKPNPEPIGLASRVFPGMTGVSMSNDSLFTEISGLPKGIDADDRFTISVDGKVIGEFTSDQTIDFRDYKSVLGDSLINGEGVKSFTVSGINPGVDRTNPLAFPIKLEFSTPTASFEMRASEQQTASEPQTVSSATIGN